MEQKKNRKRKNVYCSNCGNNGHLYKMCREPVTSFGIIFFKIVNDQNYNVTNKLKETITNSSHNFVKIDAIGIKSENSDDIKTFCKYKNNIKFLLIRRKHTLGYIEFVRGRYNVDNFDGIMFLFQQMTSEEIKRIGTNTFDYLWNELWSSNQNRMNHLGEYATSKQKFEKLTREKNINLDFFVKNVSPVWKYAEWGFPKGRRNYQESDIECAVREFEEESGFETGEFIVLDKLLPLEEKFYGTNGIAYRHVYFSAISVSQKIPKIDPDNFEQINEIGDIGWFSYDEAIKLIRPHHLDRKKLLTELYMYVINTIIHIGQ